MRRSTNPRCRLGTGGHDEQADASIRVLHVDDEPAFLEMAKDLLERENDRFAVETTTDTDDALERIADGGVDCVVSDYDMPDRDGIEFLEAVRAEHPDLPFILFTAKGSEEVASDAVSAGVTDYLQKRPGTSQYTVLANRIGNAVEQFRSRRTLEMNRRRLSLFFDQSPLGVIEWNPEFELRRMNPAAEEILGYDESDLRGRSWDPIVPEEEREAVATVVEQLLADRGGYHSVNENLRKDGERILCEWHNRVVTDADDEVVAVFSQFQDITERRAQENRLNALVESFPDVAFILDEEGRHVETIAGEQSEELFVTESERMIGRRLEEVLPADRAEEFHAVIDATLETGASQTIEYQLDTRSGRRWFEARTAPLEERIDGERAVAWVARDITARKEQERALRETKRRLALALSATDTGVWEWDLETDEVVWSETLERVMGLEPGEFDGSFEAFARRVHPEDRERVEGRLEEAIERDAVYATEFRMLTDDGDVRWVEVRGRLVDDAGNDRMVGIHHDITERKRRERELEQSDQLIETLSTTFPDYTFIYDETGVYLDVITGRRIGPDLHTPDELVGRTVEDVLDESTAERILETIRAALDTGELQTVEYRVETPTGTLWYEGHAAPIPDGYGGQPAVVLSARDVTDRKARERELAEQRDKIEALHAVATELERLDTAEAVYDAVVDAAENILEFDIAIADAAVGDALVPRAVSSDLSDEGYYDETPIDAEDNLAAEAYRTGEPSVVEDLRVHDVSPADPAFRSALTVPIGEYGVFQSVTRAPDAFDETDLELTELLIAHAQARLARLDTERQLRDRNERLEELAAEREAAEIRYRSLFENNPVVIWEEDASAVKAYLDDVTERVDDLRAYFDTHPGELEEILDRLEIVDVNERALEYYNAASKAELMDNLDRLMTEESLETNKALWASMARGETTFRAETVSRTLDGERKDELLEVRVPEAYADDYSRMYITSIDITARKERERELKRQNERLEEFASIVSHDLRNPLNVATGRLELAREACESEHLEVVSTAHDRMETLIDDLLTMARQGKTVTEMEPVDLGGTAQACWRTVATDAGTLEVVDDLTVRADGSRLRQLLENLIRNAVEHGGVGPTVTVGALTDGFFVADDGPGIPPDERERVFDSGYSTVEDGTGFGLTIVEEIAEAHGWTVTVTESDAGGARFEFTEVDVVS